jgi:hypothetical protein
MTQEMAKLGKANSASVNSMGSVQQGRYVYEWGEAKANFSGGRQILDRYFVHMSQADAFAPFIGSPFSECTASDELSALAKLCAMVH